VWVVGGLLSLAGALTYAELGVRYPDAGGIYTYLREAYGPLLGFLYGWTAFTVIMSGGIAAIAVAFGDYLGVFVPWSSTANAVAAVPLGGWTWQLSGAQVAAAAAVVGLTAVNHAGLRAGVGVQNLLTVVKIGSIVVFVVLGFLVPERQATDLLAPVAPVAGGLLAAFGVGMIAALWTYDGWYGTTFSAGEMRDPRRSLPLGLIGGTAVITALYLGINLVYLRALPVADMAASPRIGETAATVLFGPAGGRLLAAAVVVSTFGCLAATILYSPRIYLAMARDGVFFRSLATVHPRHHTPSRSLWAHAAWAVVLTVSGTYEQIYTYVVFAAVVFHVLTGAAVFVLRRRDPPDRDEAASGYRVWGYPVVPVLFILASTVLVANTLVERPVESLLGLGLVLLGVPAYLRWRRGLANIM
jgi:APA family basic amino acid/polyamine antiporter